MRRGSQAVAARSAARPRVANRLLRRVRDFAEVRSTGSISEDVADEALVLLEVDSAGLERLDREILRTIIEKFDGGPVGLSTLAIAVGEERDTIEDVYEPYLLQQGLIKRTPRGRVATPRAYEHIGLEPQSAAHWQLTLAFSKRPADNLTQVAGGPLAPSTLRFTRKVDDGFLHLPQLR